jgi:hypothetical protein
MVRTIRQSYLLDERTDCSARGAEILCSVNVPEDNKGYQVRRSVPYISELVVESDEVLAMPGNSTSASGVLQAHVSRRITRDTDS